MTMIYVLLGIFALGMTVLALYAMLGSRINPARVPAGFASMRRGTGTSAAHGRGRKPKPAPALPPPRRDDLPPAEALAAAMRSYPWEPDRQTPIAAAWSAHTQHEGCPWCAICAGDTEALARFAIEFIASWREHARTAAQMPIVGVNQAVATYSEERR